MGHSPAFVIAFMIPFCCALSLEAQNGSNRIEGVWYTDGKASKVKIYECGDDQYCGEIIWTQNHANGNPKKKDTENPDPDKRDRTIIGLDLLKGLEYNASEETWEGGTIYDPRKGKEYNCYVALEKPDKLKVRGYVGMSWMGRTTHWSRIPNHPEAP